jgi:tryptophan synthase beta chain
LLLKTTSGTITCATTLAQNFSQIMTSLQELVLNPQGFFPSSEHNFGGRFVPEMLVCVMDDLAIAFDEAIKDPQFLAELKVLQRDFAARPTPLFYCSNLTQKLGGAKIYLKNEGLVHTGAHKMNHCLGQGLLAKRMGKTRVIAETGAGQHGLATATMCATLDLECVIYMGAKDVERQRPNVFWMEQLGAKVVPVNHGGKVLRDAINEALRDQMQDPDNTHYLLGTVCGPRPYPAMNAYFQKIVGEEVKKSILEREGKLPTKLVACVGGGSNAMGFFQPFLDEDSVELIGVEAGGKGVEGTDHAARFQGGSVGVSEGMKSYFLQNEEGQMRNTHSISAGLDYSGVGPQLAYLRDIGRVKFTFAQDFEVIEAWKSLTSNEGIIPALESAHALAEVTKLAPKMERSEIIIWNMSGRGDKDLFIITKALGDESFQDYLKSQI